MESSSSYDEAMSEEKPQTEDMTYPDLSNPFRSIPIIPVPSNLPGEAFAVVIGPPVPGAHVTYPISVAVM